MQHNLAGMAAIADWGISRLRAAIPESCHAGAKNSREWFSSARTAFLICLSGRGLCVVAWLCLPALYKIYANPCR